MDSRSDESKERRVERVEKSPEPKSPGKPEGFDAAMTHIREQREAIERHRAKLENTDETTINERRAIVERAYSQNGVIPPDKLKELVKGWDLSENVRRETQEPGTVLAQWVRNGEDNNGRHFLRYQSVNDAMKAFEDARGSMSSAGVGSGNVGRNLRVFILAGPADALVGSAAPIDAETARRSGYQFAGRGGADQLYFPDKPVLESAQSLEERKRDTVRPEARHEPAKSSVTQSAPERGAAPPAVPSPDTASKAQRASS